MKIKIDTNIEEFLLEARPLLSKRAAIHSQLLGLATRSLESGIPNSFMARAYDSFRELKIVAVQTEVIRSCLVSFAVDETVTEFAESIYKSGHRFPGIVAPQEVADAFSKKWCSLSGDKAKLAVNLRLFQLESVSFPPKPSGSWRLAKDGDLNLLLDWTEKFRAEASPHDVPHSEEEMRRRLLDGIIKQHHYFWEDKGQIVCWVGSRSETEAGRWIAPVYTPPHLRGSGYASALVAEVSQLFVQKGQKVLLYTDLANPTSNSIYTKIGYRPLSDFKHILFVAVGCH